MADSSSHKPLLFGGTYRLDKQIGSGSCSQVYLGIDIISGEEVAIKLQSVRSTSQPLEPESKVLTALAGGVGVPSMWWFGADSECQYNAMVLDRLGPSLNDLFDFCNRKFSLKTVLLLADQLISIIEDIHSRCFIHRGIKPANFVMGMGKRCHEVNVIDFGLAKKFRDPKTHLHILYRDNRSRSGTLEYLSIATHLGVENSRRDDVESLAFVLIHFLRGALPWQGLRGVTQRQQFDRVMERKMTTPTDLLCQGLPKEFGIFLDYTRKLRFDDKPDYSYLRKLLRDVSVREGYQYDYVFDWRMQNCSRADGIAGPSEATDGGDCKLVQGGDTN
ncbi:kinase-like protein [Mycena vitilis]|nr:kinase-like protein [Mycena vitilis]